MQSERYKTLVSRSKLYSHGVFIRMAKILFFIFMKYNFHFKTKTINGSHLTNMFFVV